jgi:hypothetical protein
MSSGYVVAGLVGIGIALQVAIVGRASNTAHPLAVSLALQVAGVAVAGAWAHSTEPGPMLQPSLGCGGGYRWE